MEKAHLALANSPAMLIFCAIVVVAVTFQSIVFFRKSWKRGLDIGITKAQLTKVTKASGLFAIIPSLPILISYAVLVPSLGRYFPWLRLSVVGSASYETMAADMAAKATGYETIATADFTNEAFIVVMLVTSVAILGGNLFNVTVLPFYDQKVKKMQASGNAWVPVILNALFMGMYGVICAPYIANFANPTNITTMVVATIVALLIGKAASKNPKLKELVFPVSLLVGMASACFFFPLFSK